MNGIIDNLVKIELWFYKIIGLGIYEIFESKRHKRVMNLMYRNDPQGKENYKKKYMPDYSSITSIEELKEHKRRTYYRNIFNTVALIVGPLIIGPILVTGTTTALSVVLSALAANFFISAFYNNFLQRKKRITIKKEIKKLESNRRNQENNQQQNSQENQTTREQGIDQMLEQTFEREREQTNNQEQQEREQTNNQEQEQQENEQQSNQEQEQQEREQTNNQEQEQREKEQQNKKTAEEQNKKSKKTVSEKILSEVIEYYRIVKERKKTKIKDLVFYTKNQTDEEILDELGDLLFEKVIENYKKYKATNNSDNEQNNQKITKESAIKEIIKAQRKYKILNAESDIERYHFTKQTDEEIVREIKFQLIVEFMEEYEDYKLAQTSSLDDEKEQQSPIYQNIDELSADELFELYYKKKEKEVHIFEEFLQQNIVTENEKDKENADGNEREFFSEEQKNKQKKQPQKVKVKKVTRKR